MTSGRLIRLDRLNVTRLAADYSAAVRAALTASQLLNVRNGDAVAADYIDTGELLAEAVYTQRPGAESIADYGDEIAAAEERASASGYHLSRVLVGCEFSGTVRDAFAAAGHDATSCDILPTESPEGQHYTGDVRDIIGDGYHLAIFHPPCTYLAACQLWRCQRDPEREAKRIEALDFVRDLMAAPVERWALENPVGCIGTEIRPADQYVQPYEYGHDHSKKTGLWLHGLPKLEADPADYVAPRLDTYKGKPVKRWANQSPCGADRMGPSDDRGHKRSRFFAGIARAMADQWGGVASVARRAAEPLAEPVQLALI